MLAACGRAPGEGVGIADQTGSEDESATTTKRFATTGMHCPSCSMLIQIDVGDLPGVSAVSADHRTGLTEVTYDDETLDADAIVAAIVKAGYGAEVAED